MTHKSILSLDFDGVIHSYTSGWKGPDIVADEPTPGAIAFMVKALDEFDVVVYSSRSNMPGGIDAMRDWLEKHSHNMWGKLQNVRFVETKPSASVILDDRAITFTGTWPSIESLKAFKPWNKR